LNQGMLSLHNQCQLINLQLIDQKEKEEEEGDE
jgi:hypothetical protein